LSPRSDLPSPQYGGGSLYGNQYAYLAGHFSSALVQRFDTSNETVTATGDLPFVTSRHEGRADSEYGWLIGGMLSSGQNSDSVRQLDLATELWTDIATLEMPVAVSKHTSIYRDKNLWYGGGSINSYPIMNIYRLDVTDNTAMAEYRCTLSSSREHLSGINNASYGWWAGGYNQGYSGSIDRLDLFNDTTNAYQRCSLNYPRNHALGIGQLQIIQNIFAYEDSVGTYSSALEYTAGRTGFINYTLGNGPIHHATKAYIAGGRNYSDVYSTIYRLDLDDDTIHLLTSFPHRYSLFGVSNALYTWFSGGLDEFYVESGEVHKLDHSTETVSQLSQIVPISDGGDFATDTYGYILSGDKCRKLDFSTDTWSDVINQGTKINVSGSGIGSQGLFGGGLDNEVAQNSIDHIDTTTDTWELNRYQLPKSKSGVSSVTVTENTFFFGGLTTGLLRDIDSVNQLSKTAVAIPRGELSSSKSRTNSVSNEYYSWIIGGYRLSGLNDLDRINPYNDTVDLISRGPLPIRIHSAAVGSNVEPAIRNSNMLLAHIQLLAWDIRFGVFNGNRALSEILDNEVWAKDQKISQRTSIVSLVPDSTRNGLYTSSINETDEILGVITLHANTDKNGYYGSSIPFASIIGWTPPPYHNYVVPCLDPSDNVWVQGGLFLQNREKISGSTWSISIRGISGNPRAGAATVGSPDRAWFGGGGDPTVSNIVELLIFSTDTSTSNDRTDLSISRWKLGATNDSNYGWFIGGIGPSGPLGTIDKLDKSNDTATAELRNTLAIPRYLLGASFINDKAYLVGGLFESKSDFLDYFDPSNDTQITIGQLSQGMHSHSMATVYESSLHIFHESSLYIYDESNNTLQTHLNGLASTLNQACHVLGPHICVTGGTLVGGGSLLDYKKYDPSNSTYTDQGDMSTRRYNHVMAGESSLVNSVSNVRLAILPSLSDAVEILALTPRVSEDNTRNGLTSCGYHYTDQRTAEVIVPILCTYDVNFESAYVISTDNHLLKFAINCGQPQSFGSLPVPCVRTSSLTTPQTGWIIGGSSNRLVTVNLSTATAQLQSQWTDDTCNQASCIPKDTQGLVIGGCRYTGAVNDRLVITDRVRQLDFASHTLSELYTNTTKDITRAAGYRGPNQTGYLLGGSVTIDHQVTSEVQKVDLTTDIFTLSPQSLDLSRDLLGGIIDAESKIILSDGQIWDTTTDTPSNSGVWPQNYGGCFVNQSSRGLIIGGSSDRVEDPAIQGRISAGTYLYQPSLYDLTTGLRSYCSESILQSSWSCGPIFPFQYCSPEIKAYTITFGVLPAKARYSSWILGGFPDIEESRTGYSPKPYGTEESTVIGVFYALGVSMVQGEYSAMNQYEMNRTGYITHATINYSSTILDNTLECIERATSDKIGSYHSSFRYSVRGSEAQFSPWNHLVSQRNCHLYIGGKISTRRACLPKIPSVRWDLTHQEPLLELFEDRNVDIGNLQTILTKMVKAVGGTINWETILQDVNARFGDEDFIYCIDNSRGVFANRGVLIRAGQDLQIINLLVRISGTDMWIKNQEGTRFFVTSGKEYDITKVGHLPISGKIMLIQLKLMAPLTPGQELNFEFLSTRSRCHMKLMPV